MFWILHCGIWNVQIHCGICELGQLGSGNIQRIETAIVKRIFLTENFRTSIQISLNFDKKVQLTTI